MSVRTGARCRAADETGAFIVLWALLIVGLLTMVALVVDLGSYRAQGRSNQLATDLAALSAGKVLAGTTSAPGTPRAACEAAYNYAVINVEGWAGTTPSPCSNMPVSGCPATPVVSTATSGDTTIVITYPVDFGPADSRVNDGTRCERIKVAVNSLKSPFFAQVIGAGPQRIPASAVARAWGANTSASSPAVLLLETRSCQALSTSGNQSSLHVLGYQTSPGYVQVNTNNSLNCSGTPNTSRAQDWAAYATSLTSNLAAQRGYTAGITVDGAETALAGATAPRAAIFGVTALTNVAAKTVENGGSDVGVRPTPTPGTEPLTRDPVDSRYLSYIQALRSSTETLGMSPTSQGYTKLSSRPGGGCTFPGGITVVAETKLFIDCNPNVANNGLVQFTGRHFVVAGPLVVANNTTLTFTDPSEIVVNNANPASPGISVGGALNVNTGVVPATPGASYCGTQRRTVAGLGPGPSRIVVRSGGMTTTSSNAVVRLCQTMVYLSHLASPTPANDNNGSLALVQVGNGAVDWTAPNQQAGPSCRVISSDPTCYNDAQTSPVDLRFEDLALWTEAAGTGGPGVNASVTSGNFAQIGGGGSVAVSGVLFIPNAHVRYGGQALNNVAEDAQYIARSLYLSGQANMVVRPSPNNSIPFRQPQFSLIR